MKQNPEKLKVTANLIRQDIIKMLFQAGSGHPAGALGLADIFTCLYFSIARLNPQKPLDPNRDRIILSNGHACPALYAALARRGFFSLRKLKTLRKLNSPLQGHPHLGDLPGIENSSGPLGQGISLAAGLALAGKIDRKDYRVFCLMSDGELNEGQSWEAFMLAAKHRLNNLIVIVDRNYIQIDGFTEKVMPLDPLKEKFLAFNFETWEINGHGLPSILNAFAEAKNNRGKPKVIIAKNTPGQGVSFMKNDFCWHGKTIKKEEMEKALKELRYEK